MSQCHDPYDPIEGPTVIDHADSGAPNAAQCHDSYDKRWVDDGGFAGRGGQDRHDNEEPPQPRRTGPVPAAGSSSAWTDQVRRGTPCGGPHARPN